ncbi:MAG: Hsp20/alpha crystallin family protein [Devosia sp.]
MVETATRLPIKNEAKAASASSGAGWQPFEDLRREVNRLFEDFGRGAWLGPLRSTSIEPLFRNIGWNAPAVDVAEKDGAFEITADLPGFDAKDVEVTLRNGNIVLSGEKQQDKEEKAKDFYLKERHYGSFERSFSLPEGVDVGKVSATFRNGVLSVTLPKTAEAQKPAKKVEIKAA